MKLPISALILTQNSAATLKRCLDSLQRLDEVVIVDGGSRDNTKEIAESYPNVVFYENPWPGFIAQREFSRKKAKHAWCLMLDSDECVADDCLDECQRVIEQKDPLPLYNIVRTEFFNGVAIESGHGMSEYQERLFLRDRIEYTGGVHHQHLIDGVLSTKTPSLVGYFPRKFRIDHNPHYGVYEWMLKVPRFALIIAKEKQALKKVSLWELLICFPGNFLKIYLKSFREGKVAVIIAIQTAIIRTLIKMRVYELQNFEKATKEIDEKTLG